MRKDIGGILAVLKSELNFLEKGGYWKPSSHQGFIFQDSPTCLNYGCLEDSRPCCECAFFWLVPLDRQNAKIPCRHIALNEHGETLDSLYGRGAQQEVIETAVARWLRAAIQALECEQARNQSLHPETKAKTEVVSILSPGDVNLGRAATRFPKRANPECSATKGRASVEVARPAVYVGMPCKSCGSFSWKKFIAEMSIRSSGLENIDEPAVLVYPELIVCLHCGEAEFRVSKADLRALAKGDAAAAG